MKPYKIRREGDYRDKYYVTERGSYTSLGRIEKRAQHYNLARPVTVVEWYAYPLDGQRPKRFRTRGEAADWLWDNR